MGFFDDDDDGDLFSSKADQGSKSKGAAAAPPKPAVKPASKPVKPLLDDDDDDFFADFSVDLDLDLRAPAAAAPSTSTAAVPTAAAPPRSALANLEEDGDDDMGLLGNSDDLVMGEADGLEPSRMGNAASAGHTHVEALLPPRQPPPQDPHPHPHLPVDPAADVQQGPEAEDTVAQDAPPQDTGMVTGVIGQADAPMELQDGGDGGGGCKAGPTAAIPNAALSAASPADQGVPMNVDPQVPVTHGSFAEEQPADGSVQERWPGCTLGEERPNAMELDRADGIPGPLPHSGVEEVNVPIATGSVEEAHVAPQDPAQGPMTGLLSDAPSLTTDAAMDPPMGAAEPQLRDVSAAAGDSPGPHADPPAAEAAVNLTALADARVSDMPQQPPQNGPPRPQQEAVLPPPPPPPPRQPSLQPLPQPPQQQPQTQAGLQPQPQLQAQQQQQQQQQQQAPATVRPGLLTTSGPAPLPSLLPQLQRNASLDQASRTAVTAPPPPATSLSHSGPVAAPGGAGNAAAASLASPQAGSNLLRPLPLAQSNQRRLTGAALIGGARAAGGANLSTPQALSSAPALPNTLQAPDPQLQAPPPPPPPPPQQQQQQQRMPTQVLLSAQSAGAGPSRGLRPGASLAPPVLPQQPQPQAQSVGPPAPLGSAGAVSTAAAAATRPALNLLGSRLPAAPGMRPQLNLQSEGAQPVPQPLVMPLPDASAPTAQQQSRGLPRTPSLAAPEHGPANVPCRSATAAPSTLMPAARVGVPLAPGTKEPPATPSPGQTSPAVQTPAPRSGPGLGLTPSSDGPPQNEARTPPAAAHQAVTPVGLLTTPVAGASGAAGSVAFGVAAAAPPRPNNTTLAATSAGPAMPAPALPPGGALPVSPPATTLPGPTAGMAGSVSALPAPRPALAPPAPQPARPAAMTVPASAPPPPASRGHQLPSGPIGFPPQPEQLPDNVSFAAVLADPIKALEMMILELQGMRDQAMDLRVQSAVLSNQLVRLDNPMLRDRIRDVKAEAVEALHTNDELLAELLPEAATAAEAAGAGSAPVGPDDMVTS